MTDFITDYMQRIQIIAGLVSAAYIFKQTKRKREAEKTQSKLVTKLQALVNHILPPSTAIIGYAISLHRLSVSWQVFIGAQMTVSLLTVNSNSS